MIELLDPERLTIMAMMMLHGVMIFRRDMERRIAAERHEALRRDIMCLSSENAARREVTPDPPRPHVPAPSKPMVHIGPPSGAPVAS